MEDQQDVNEKISGGVPPGTEEITTSVPSKTGAIDKNRVSLMRQLKTIISDQRNQKFCQDLVDIDLSSKSTEELQELLEDIYHAGLSASTYGVIESAVKAGIPALEAYSVSNKSFPLRLRGYSQALELHNPDSTVNTALYFLDVQLGSSMRLTPLQTLGSKLLLAAFACHTQNKLTEGIEEDLNKKASTKLIDEIDKLP